MEMQYFKDYSPALGRDMECKIYGHAGRPMLYIPCQDGRFFDFENFHMNDTLAPWIDAGQDVYKRHFQDSADRLCIPKIPVEDYIQAVETLVDVDRDWVPHSDGASLYIRCLLYTSRCV